MCVCEVWGGGNIHYSKQNLKLKNVVFLNSKQIFNFFKNLGLGLDP